MSAHDVLRISPSATTTEIRQAYKARLLEAHPDKPGGNRQAFDAVNAAYDQLTKLPGALRSVIVDTVFLGDMDVEDDEAFLGCRCGDFFSVPVEQICSPCVIVGCRGCSLSIRVLHDDD